MSGPARGRRHEARRRRGRRAEGGLGRERSGRRFFNRAREKVATILPHSPTHAHTRTSTRRGPITSSHDNGARRQAGGRGREGWSAAVHISTARPFLCVARAKRPPTTPSAACAPMLATTPSGPGRKARHLPSPTPPSRLPFFIGAHHIPPHTHLRRGARGAKRRGATPGSVGSTRAGAGIVRGIERDKRWEESANEENARLVCFVLAFPCSPPP